MKTYAWVLALFFLTISPASAQVTSVSRPDAASAAILEHIYKQIEQREGGVSPIPGFPGGANQAFINAEFSSTRERLRQLGAKAWPLGPRVAELLQKTERNQFDLAWILFDLTPDPGNDPSVVGDAIRRFRASSGASRLEGLATLGKIGSPSALLELKTESESSNHATRLLAVIGSAFAGKADPETAGLILIPRLKDQEPNVRTAAANSLRLLGASALIAAPALIEYLKTRDNVYAASAALNNMPLDLVRPAKQELENILGDTRLNSVQKRHTLEILTRFEVEK